MKNAKYVLVSFLALALALLGACQSLAEKNGRAQLQAAVERAEAARADVVVGGSGAPGAFWVAQAEWDALDAGIKAARQARSDENSLNAALAALKEAVFVFNNAKKTDGSDPYHGAYPGSGPERISVAAFDFDAGAAGWELSGQFNDGRWNNEGSVTGSESFGNGKLKLEANFDGVPTNGKAYDGVAVKYALPVPLALTDQTYVQFDFFYPMNSQAKLMRFELWSTSTGGASNTGSGGNKIQVYVRPDALEYLNGPVAGEYDLQTYRVKKLVFKVPGNLAGKTWDDLRLDLHGETNSAWAGGVLFIDNLEILQQGAGDPIPPVVNKTAGVDAPSLKGAYGDQFLIGSLSPGAAGYNDPASLLFHQFNAVTPGNTLKADSVHPNPPAWLVEETGYAFKANPDRPEYTLESQDAEFSAARNNGFAIHGHVLAWFNQGAPWMTQIIPEHVTSNVWQPSGAFYLTGNGAAGPFFNVPKDLARRAYYNHILHELRHFMTTDSRYTGTRLSNSSSADDGIIAFRSFDVLNEEIHETRHTTLVPADENVWKPALRNTSWLMALSDDDYGDIRQHYIYLIFKYAHIAVPNAQMAAKYQANYAALPDYMKRDANDDGPANGIDAFVSDKPPTLYYNDYDLHSATKAKVTYNMVKELNTAWQTDPLFDGRPLIEGIGIQGHDTVSPTLASQNQDTIALFASLVDEGLLTTIAISELDLAQPDSAPGGAASSTNGDILNQTQADTIGYQFALLWKVYLKFSKYLERVTIWGSNDPGWGGSYKPFDAAQMAAPAYYGIMNPDKFIIGHSYLDYFFDGEFDKVK
jgi:GH35 family endo-1,4-beta-xylanase